MYVSEDTGQRLVLIAIEGGDKLGKQTQAQALADRLRLDGYSVAQEEVPWRDGVTRPRIYDMLFSGEAVKFPVVFQTIQGTNRRVMQALHMPKLCANHQIVVLDRWNASTWVYGRASGVGDNTTSTILSGIQEADLTLVFDGEAFPTPGKEDDTYEADKKFQRQVREGYRTWCVEQMHRAKLVNANRPKEVVHEEIYKAVMEWLAKHAPILKHCRPTHTD